ncbi:MAG: BLUF domain-containing protein [Hyphomonadaceae bacterium]|nr:BLUF domain-containing protein [Hyphomonadaceae bacterium]
MKRIIYKSRAKPWIKASDIGAILHKSRLNNLRCGLTGLLVYTKGNFLQVLEGLDKSVESTFARIEADPRHTICEIVQETEIFEPDFGQWLMGFWTDDISHVDRGRGLVSVPELIQEFDSEWLEQKSALNQLLLDEILKLRVETAA